MRPRGSPPMPSAMSSPNEPDGMTLISGGAWSTPRRMMDPLPYCFSMVPIASSIALSRLGSRCSFAISRLLFSPPEGNSCTRDVLSALRAQFALIENDLADRRSAAIAVAVLPDQIRQAALAFLDPSDGHVRPVWTLFL